MYINLLWLREDLHSQGISQRLLAFAAQEAQRRGTRHAFLETISFPAPVFHKRHGCRVFSVLNNFPPRKRRYYICKQLL